MIFDEVHWTRVLKRSTYLILTLFGLYLSFKLAVFYIPFLIAFIISLIMEPAIKFLMNKASLTRKTSSIIIFIIVFGITVGLLVWGIVTLITEATELLQTLNYYLDTAYKQIQNLIDEFQFDSIRIPTEIMNIIQNSTGEVFNYLANWIKNFLTNVINVVTSIPTIAIYFVVTILALYFICTDKIYILDQMEHHFPKKWSKKMLMHIREIASTLGAYLKAQVILILISFIISVIGLYFLKFAGLNIEFPLLIALGIGFVDALPILGSGTVMIPWGVGAALNGDIKLALAIIGLWILMSIVRQFIEPRIVSKQIGIHPIFTLIAMYTGFKFIGLIGLIIGPIILIILNNIFSNLIDKGVLKTIFDKT
ncbi:MAG: sporulation integral membrane protein YtvI [Clostridia bacterium]|nr:sporulation integral membrane protein YtvI [Clostridia bacterium]